MENELMKALKQAFWIVFFMCALAFALGCLAKENVKSMETCQDRHSTYYCHNQIYN